jgi:hypothetical protein
MSELLYSLVTEFKGDYPDVPLAPGVDVEGIKQDDPNPFFVTLPLLRVGGKSDNGFTWQAQDVDRVMSEINTKRVEGGVGHIPKEKRSTQYDLPKLRWVGATLNDETLWGKAYIPTYAEDVRTYFKNAIRSGARVGTSVYGVRGKQGLSDMVLESIDLGHPDRLGYKGAGAVPLITSEIANEDTDVSENTNDALVAELRTDRDAQRELVSELQDTIKAHESTIAELETSQTTLQALVSELSLDTDNPLADAKVLVAELAATRARNLVTDVKAVIAEMVELKELQPFISEYLIEETDDGAERALVGSVDEAKARVTGLLAKDNFKSLAKSLVREQRGFNAIVHEAVGDKGDLDFSEQAVRTAMSKFGVGSSN